MTNLLHFVVSLRFITPVHAASQGFNLIGQIPCADRGDCTITEIINGFGILMNWAVSISGAIALLLFIVGGVYLLASAGRADWVKRGKDILVGTSVALFFIFSSWLIVNFVVTALVQDNQFKLQPGLETAPYGPNLDGPNIFCQQENREGVLCGGPETKGAMICHNQRCISKCSYQFLSTGQDYECRQPTDCNFLSGGNCQNSINCQPGSNLCAPKAYLNPSATLDYVCCYPAPQ
jgi:hypothetical protein